ncbi:hypothetical protein SIN8267_02939 [Sinobacterium norvegicum]|uniref:Uncharacterized protein n=1 Tax=Sinobacterium norvegicum TaxID=1641715 RepID=A0ABN8EN32_9GAMM|nr:DUF6776 family protein [Sinobacterium norvegicum]CAH0992802.1 hypothetical protein SIN8267_02939 [Sinobacterium norvegicum]
MSKLSQDIPLVIHYQRQQLILLVIGIVVLLGLIVGASYWAGYNIGFDTKDETTASLVALRSEFQNTTKELSDSQQLLANARADNNVLQLAQQSIREDLNSYRQTIDMLQQDLQFYRSAIDPGDDNGLSVYDLEVVGTEDPLSFHYNIVFVQRVMRHSLLNGVLQLKIVGSQNGRVVELELKEVSDTVDSTDIKLRFKYFQNIVGELTLPEGFEPKELHLTARSIGRASKTIDMTYAWEIKEST